MLIWEIVVGLGFLFLLAALVFFLNPPEAWVKRMYLKRDRRNQGKRES